MWRPFLVTFLSIRVINFGYCQSALLKFVVFFFNLYFFLSFVSSDLYYLHFRIICAKDSSCFLLNLHIDLFSILIFFRWTRHFVCWVVVIYIQYDVFVLFFYFQSLTNERSSIWVISKVAFDRYFAYVFCQLLTSKSFDTFVVCSQSWVIIEGFADFDCFFCLLVCIL